MKTRHAITVGLGKNLVKGALVILAAFLFGAASGLARDITREEASRAVGNWVRGNDAPLGAQGIAGMGVADVETKTDEDGTELYHVVRLESGAVVITSAESGILPIIAFSDSDGVNAGEEHPIWDILRADMRERREAVVQARGATVRPARSAKATGAEVDDGEASGDAIGKNESAWDELLHPKIARASRISSISDVRVPALTRTSWGQDVVGSKKVYNYYTPNYYYCGCTATALAQLMRYHEYPQSSLSSFSRTCWVDGNRTTKSTRGGTYSWSSMPTNPARVALTSTQQQAIGKLCYDAGVSVNMDWGSEGSGSWVELAAASLKNDWKYSSAVCFHNQGKNIAATYVKLAVLANLDAKMPVLLDIKGTKIATGKTAAHAVVGDGYGFNGGTPYTHINLGWDGSAHDSYWYNLPTIEAGSYSYTVLRGIVYNVFPTKTGSLITGRVLDSSNRPRQGVTVKGTNGGTTITGTTDVRGIYALWAPRAGTYSVVATSGGLSSPAKNVTVSMCSTAGCSLNTTDGSLNWGTTGSIGNSWGNDLVLNAGQPDLESYIPSERGWSDAVYVTGTKGSTDAMAKFKVSSTIYLNLAYQNGGTAVAKKHQVSAAIVNSAGTTVASWTKSMGVLTNQYYRRWTNIAFSIKTPGTYTAKVTLDSQGQVAESDEYDNTYYSAPFEVVVPTVTSLAISGSSSVAPGRTATYACTAYYSDGTSKRVSPSWSVYTGSAYGSISSDGGVFEAYETFVQRNVTIQATFGGKSAWKTVEVVPPTEQIVSFDRGDGTTAAAKRTYKVGQAYGSLPKATLAGHALLGWFTHREGGVQVLETDIVPPWTPRTLFAHWTTEQKAAFNANGGSCSTASLTATIGGVYPALPTPSKTGYAFAGWYTTAGGGSLVQSGDTVTATATRTLYAHWTTKQKVIFDGVGGTPAVACRTNTIGNTYGKFPAATLAGQALLGWFTHRVGGTQVLSTDIVPPWTPRTLFAHWTTEQKATFNANGGFCSTASLTATIGGAYPALPTPSKTGYAFAGWYTKASGGTLVQAGDTVTATASRTLYAHWTKKQKVIFDGVGGEPAVACRTNTIGGAYGKFPTATLAGQALLGWFTHRVGGTQVLPTDIVPEWTPRTLFAHWTTEQTVVFDANGGTTPEAQRKRTIGTTYGTLPAATRPGYALLGWYTKASGGSAVAAGATVTAVATRTLYAHWTDRQVTTFKGNGGTPSTQKTTNTIYATYGAMPTAQLSGHVFLGWFNAAEGGKQVYTDSTVTLAAERTLYAHWTDRQVVTFKGNGGTPSAQKTTNTIYAKYGAFPSVSWANHVFLGWYTAAAEGDGKRVYTNSTVTLAGTRTLWAQWTDKQVVTFRGNGGSPDVQRHTNTMGKAYGTLPEPKRSGHVFQGWFTAEEGGTQVKGADKATAATARTLYAHWTDKQVTTFKGNGGTPSTQKTTNTIYAAYGTLPSATRSGQVLEGWYTAADGGKRVYTNSTVTLAAARTLYAHWTDQQVVTFKGNGGRPGTQKTTNTIYAKYGAFPSVEWSGHVFQGWYNAAEGGKRVYTNSTVTLSATRTLYAHWTTGRGFAITAIAVGAGDGEDGPSPRAVGGEEKAENVCRLRFELSAGTEYEIQWTPSMAAEWETVERLVAETDGEVEVEIEVPGGEKGFFRLVVFEDGGEED
jgi:uncharacterized repeat protein (TIGR02543 family)